MRGDVPTRTHRPVSFALSAQDIRVATAYYQVRIRRVGGTKIKLKEILYPEGTGCVSTAPFS